jgi:hypothetical protein
MKRLVKMVEDEEVLEKIEDNADFKFLLNKKKLNRFELDLIMNR